MDRRRFLLLTSLAGALATPLAAGAIRGRVERTPELVKELIGLRVDVIVASGPTVLAAKTATRPIPIVCVATGDPVRFGLVESLARLGGNVTGLALIVDREFVGKWLELVTEAAPRIRQGPRPHDSAIAAARNRTARRPAAFRSELTLSFVPRLASSQPGFRLCQATRW